MRGIASFLSSVLVASALITGTAFAADEFATLKGVKATPMASSELGAVKGLHFHFLDGAGGFHLVNIGPNGPVGKLGVGGDGEPIGAGYNGLCVAMGNPGITIPGGAAQCP